MNGATTSGKTISLWTVYHSPADFPGKFVAQRWQDEEPTGDMFAADDLEELRRMLPPGLHRLPPHPADDPVIVEVWF